MAMNAPPYKIKVVEPITLPDAERRREALAEAGYNTFLLRSDDVFVDLLTDSGTGAVSQEQRAAMELGDESYAGSRSFFRLERAVREVYGYKHVVPTHQGRGAEHLLARVLVRPGQLVPSNLYFTTSRVHAELAGGIWTDVSIPEARDPESTHPFKGNIDVAKLEELLRRQGHVHVAFVRREACLNMAGGQPFSIENLTDVRAVTLDYGVPLILDATRSSENALFVKRREPGYAQRSLPEIIRLIAGLSDGAIFSSKKDHFVPIGGLVAVNDDWLAERLRELVVVYEGFPHYGGMSGAAMEALAQGSTRRRTSGSSGTTSTRSRISRRCCARPACRSWCRSARTRCSSTRSASCRTCRRSSSRRRRSPRRSTSPAACARWSGGSSRASTARTRTTGSSSSG